MKDMDTARSVRIYHALLATLALVAYFFDRPRYFHAVVGYIVTAIILFRALWALKGDPQLSLSRFIPSFKGMTAKNVLTHSATSKTITLVVMLSLLGAAATGIALDKGRTLGFGAERQMSEQHRQRGPDGHREKSFMAEAHETFADIFIIFAVLHLAHSLAFQRPMAKFMLFLSNPKRPTPPKK